MFILQIWTIAVEATFPTGCDKCPTCPDLLSRMKELKPQENALEDKRMQVMEAMERTGMTTDQASKAVLFCEG